MTEQDAWDIYFSGICSIRFHPRDDTARSNDWAKVERAANIADMMLQQRKIRWQDGEQPQARQ